MFTKVPDAFEGHADGGAAEELFAQYVHDVYKAGAVQILAEDHDLRTLYIVFPDDLAAQFKLYRALREEMRGSTFTYSAPPNSNSTAFAYAFLWWN